MRHLPTPVFTAALLLSACINPLNYQAGQAEEVLIMNAQLRADETEHAVWLNLGRINKVEDELTDATLDCYVNGRPVARAMLEEYSRNKYVFSAGFRPGDEIRLEAARGPLHASATVTVLQPARLVAVDTLTVSDSPYGSYYGSAKALRCRLRLEDLPGEANWYRIRAVLNGTETITYADTSAVDIYPMDYEPLLDFCRDPILNDSYRVPPQGWRPGMAPAEENAIYNHYCSFRDVDFAGRTAEVELYIPERELRYGYPDILLKGETRTFTRNLHLSFMTLSLEEFSFLSAMNTATGLGFDWNIITEPIHFPSNVEGGIGLVCVSSSSDMTIGLPGFVMGGEPDEETEE